MDRWETYVGSLSQSGGLGLYGDFLLQDYTRYGASVQETLLGPTIGDVSTVTKWSANLLHGKVPPLNEVLREGIGATPFANIWYTRAAMNYLFLSAIYQDINPAYLSRMKRNLREEGRKQIFEPLSYD